jgi:hypothetical protein
LEEAFLPQRASSKGQSSRKNGGMQSRCQKKIKKGSSCEEAGGASMILANTKKNLEEDLVDVHVLPAILGRI